MTLTGHPFDDENVAAFETQAAQLLAAEQNRKASDLIDISPTTWSFVPLLLVRLTAQMLPEPATVIYLQYGVHALRFRPLYVKLERRFGTGWAKYMIAANNYFNSFPSCTWERQLLPS